MFDRRRERRVHEELGDVVVLAAGQQDAVGVLDRAPGPTDLLVVGDGRARPLVVDDEAEIGLVEAHPERDRRDERLHLVGDQGVLERLALLGREVGVVGAGIDALRAQERGDALGVGDGQAVDDAAPRHEREVLGEPGQALRLVRRGRSHRAAASAAPSGPRRHRGALRRAARRRPRRPGRWRSRSWPGPGRAGRARCEDPADAPVVGPEVVAPVGDAVRLVDDEQADRALDARQDVAS